MPEGTVQSVGKSRTGKPTVTIEGQIYSASKLEAFPQAGDRVSFESASSIYNGATVWFLNSWKLLSRAPVETKYAPSVPQPPREIAAPASAQHPQGGITDAERPFISNCVAHAIASGAIKEPEQIEKWVSAAKNALRSQSE